MPRVPYQDPDTQEWLLPLTRGYTALISEEDVTYVSQWNWCVFIPKQGYTVYAVRTDRTSGRSCSVFLHHAIAERIELVRPQGMEIDHIDHNGLNNKRANLRLATHAQNMRNRSLVTQRNTSGVKGVRWHTSAQKWCAEIRFDGKYHYLGLFLTREEAAEAYAKASRDLHGEFGFTASTDP